MMGVMMEQACHTKDGCRGRGNTDGGLLRRHTQGAVYQTRAR